MIGMTLCSGIGAPEMAAPWVDWRVASEIEKFPRAVRRLTPTECARLQGFPDDHTAIAYRGKPAADGPQYKAFGNSMAVPCIKWIMDRMRDSISHEKEPASEPD